MRATPTVPRERTRGPDGTAPRGTRAERRTHPTGDRDPDRAGFLNGPAATARIGTRRRLGGARPLQPAQHAIVARSSAPAGGSNDPLDADGEDDEVGDADEEQSTPPVAMEVAALAQEEQSTTKFTPEQPTTGLGFFGESEEQY